MGLEDLEQVSGGSKNVKASEEPGLLERILALLMGSGDPEKEKRRLLKQIAKDLKKSRYKFYNPKGNQALPGFAKFFYDIYKVVGPAQALLRNSEASTALKNIIIEMSLTEEQVALKDSFSEEKVREKSAEMDTKQLAMEIKDGMVTFFSAFTNDVMKNINTTYSLFAIFHSFAMYDYYFLLKKFDSKLSEKDFAYNPRFEAINGEYICDDLKDFLEVLVPLEKEAEWDHLFDVLKEYRNLDIVSRPAWKKLSSHIQDIKNSGILELIIQYTEKDPYYKPVFTLPKERIVEPYLNKFKTQTEMTIQKILQDKKNQKTEKLAQLVFGTGVISRMKNYTERANAMFSKKMLGGFSHTVAANYLKAFMLDYVKKDMRELRDLLIIRGKWTTNLLSQQMSDSFQQIMAVSDSLMQFDDACADEGDYGIKMRKVINRAERDQGAMKILRDTVKEVNDRAAVLIGESAHGFIAFGKNLKALIDDYDNAANAEIIINWKEVDSAAEGTIKQKMVNVYKRIYYFVQLLQMYVKTEST